MSAGKYDILIEQGATFTRTLKLTDSTGAPVVLTSYTARMQVRSDVESSTIIISLTTENGRISITGATGQIDLLITSTDTAALSFTRGVYDLEIISPAAVVTRLLSGSVDLSRESTR